jgi:hypothetical protein
MKRQEAGEERCVLDQAAAFSFWPKGSLARDGHSRQIPTNTTKRIKHLLMKRPAQIAASS